MCVKSYNAVHKCRPLRSGGGVSIYIQDFLEYYTREDLCYQNSIIESVFIEIDKDQIGKDKNVIIGVVYRPPNSDIYLFNDCMSEILTKMKCERKYVLCLDDYNISLLHYDTHGPTQEFVDLLYSHSLLPCISKPIRVTAKSASLIDNIFCNSGLYDDNALTGILYTDISDHFPFFISMAHLKRRILLCFLTQRTFSEQNIAQFFLKLRARDWSDLMTYNDPEIAYTVFSNTIKRIKRNKKEITENFNSFFVNVGPNLAKKISPTSQSPTSFMTSNCNGMVVLPVNQSEIIDIIKTLKHSRPGWDAISANVVKVTYPCFIEPLAHIMNLSIKQGIFPNELKLAKVIPLYKASDPMVFSNYKPVSVLPLFSKILEHLMYTRLLSFINKHKLLYSYQFGFRRGHSPDLALICLVDRISNALENGEDVLGLFFDFSKAFDTVNHDV